MAFVSLPPMKRFLKITVRHRDQWHGPSEAGESREIDGEELNNGLAKQE